MNRRCFRALLGNLALFLCAMALIPEAMARDVRLALLVGNQRGWKKDPFLRYALEGDLRPMARTLRGLGFTVKTLENQNAQQLRKALAWVRQRLSRSPQVSTFLFYYTGHSDRSVLHLGKRSDRPVSYRELLLFFQSLRIARRFVILDSCFSGEIIRKFGSLSRYQQLVPKGARARRFIDLSKELMQQSDERSFQILSSGLAISWESRRYRSSIFTYHLLRGLRGSADRDKDGKISIDELFTFVSDEMMRDIQEKPQMFGVVRRSRPYVLAPAYSSHLWIQGNVVGTLKVSVANFYWSWKKRISRPMRLALVHGQGRVELKRGAECWQQDIVLPKGGLARLNSRWHRMPCAHFAQIPKGSIQLNSQLAEASISRPWSLEARFGVLQSPLLSDSLWVGGQLGFRHRFWGVYLGLWGTQTRWDQQAFSHLNLDLFVEAGYRDQWRWFGLFVGGYVGGSLVFQDINQDPGIGPLFHYGLTVQPSFWLSPRWAITLHLRAGFVLGQLGQRLSHQFSGMGLIGLSYRL